MKYTGLSAKGQVDRQLWRFAERLHPGFQLSTDHQCVPVSKGCIAGQRATCKIQKMQSQKPHSTRNISCSPNPGWKILSFTERGRVISRVFLLK